LEWALILKVDPDLLNRYVTKGRFADADSTLSGLAARHHAAVSGGQVR
jgi:hypothetical protein